MPRIARKKTNDSIFHIMARSISEVDLFMDEQDKLIYLSKVKKYQKLYKFRVYGYCLMDNHVHLIIDANGADISRIMHSINFSYAMYFNGEHSRHGHLFQDRFKSKIVTDERYLITLSAYIHNNPIDIAGYEDCPEKYEFSSLSVYLGLRKDPYELIDDEFILGMFGKKPKDARERYMNFVYVCNDKKIKEGIEFEDEGTEYRSERRILVRDIKAEDIVKFVINKMEVPQASLCSKYSKGMVTAKAMIIFLMRLLCNFKCKDICSILGNITQGRVSALSSIGISLVSEDRFAGLVGEFLSCYSS